MNEYDAKVDTISFWSGSKTAKEMAIDRKQQLMTYAEPKTIARYDKVIEILLNCERGAHNLDNNNRLSH